MKANESPEKIYLHPDIGGKEFIKPWLKRPFNENSIEYTRTDAFIERAVNFLNNNLDDVVEIRVSGTIIPHRVLKRDFIDEFAKYMKVK